MQDARPFVVGLSDDAGGSAQLGLASRVALAPTVLQASRLDDYVYWTLLGVKNDTALPPLFSLQDADNRILMTLFYFYVRAPVPVELLRACACACFVLLLRACFCA